MEPAASTLQHRLLAILQADAVGYSRLMSEDDVGTLAALEAARALFRQSARDHGGRVVDTAGDSVVAAFDTATGAVQAAAQVQARVAADAASPGQRPLAFRVGIHLGDVIIQPDGTLYGEGVNVAARLQALAETGGILVSDAVRAAVRPEIAVRLADRGEHTMKNIERPVRAYAMDGSAAPAAAPAPSTASAASAAPAAATAAGAFSTAREVQGFGGRPALAVLPFDNLSTDPEQGHLADGIAEDILTRLALARWLPVIGRNSSFAYRGANVDLKKAGAELGARYLLEGSIRKAGDRVRITAQLIDATTAHHVWAQRYDRVLTDIFAVQDEIVDAILDALEAAVDTAEISRVHACRSCALGAWELHHEALWHLGHLDRQSFEHAIDLFLQSAQQDPSFAPPLAMAATANFFRALLGWRPLAECFEDSRRMARDALQRDPEHPAALAISAADAVLGGRHAAARKLADKAVAINPSYAHGRYVLGWILLLDGDPAAAAAQVETALRLNPHDVLAPMMLGTLSASHYMKGDLAAARETALLGIDKSPGFPMNHRSYASACGMLGLLEEGRVALDRFLELSPHYSEELARRTMPFRLPQDGARYLEGLHRLGWPPA